jgi:hypothetical protein
MPMDAASLRAAAVQADRDAGEARDVALDLDRHHMALEHRRTPILDRHTAEVWNSRAATASRLRLRISATSTLGRARAAIADAIEQVRRRADILETMAIDYRREAARLDALAAEAAALTGGVGDDGSGSSPVLIPDRIR